MQRLNWVQVCEIRAKYMPGRYPTRQLAREYGVSASTIWRIISGKAWKTAPNQRGRL